MGTPVTAIRAQHVSVRENNDLQLAVQKLATQVNNSALNKKTLGTTSDNVPGALWAAPATNSYLIVKHVETASTLQGCTVVFQTAIPSSTIDYRTISLVRKNSGNEYQIASIDTRNTAIVINAPLALTFNAKATDLEFASGDVLSVKILGGGALPLLGEGVFSFAWAQK